MDNFISTCCEGTVERNITKDSLIWNTPKPRPFHKSYKQIPTKTIHDMILTFLNYDMVRLWAISQHWTNIKGSDFILLQHYLILNVGLSIIYIVFNADFRTFHLHVELTLISS